MTIFVALFGLLVLAGSALAVVRPDLLMSVITGMDTRVRWGVAVGIRLVFGALMILAAPACPYPTVIAVLGWITVAAAIGLALMGSARMERFVRWWTERPAGVVRAWGVFGAGLGLFLIHAAI